jgi:small-conductance mechanosensitive channel
MVLLKRLGQVFVTIIGLSIATTHFGLNITLGSTVLLFLAVVVAIGARAAIADATSGFIILTDRPFQVGDDILIKELDSWGTVLEIGIRSTRLRTLDNRQVIIPNSQIGQSQVINYSSPEPSFRAKTDIGVVYGTEFDQLERVITAAVRRVEGVLPDKPVDVFFLAFGDSARQIRVWWWIDSVNNLYPILTRVNATLQTALNDAGIEIPFPIYNLNLKTEAEHDGRATQALSDQSRKEEPI